MIRRIAAVWLSLYAVSSLGQVTSYSTTPSDNNSSPPNGAPEGMAPGAVNDVIRQVMADIATEAQRNAVKVLSGVAGTNTITASMTPALDAYSAGMLAILVPAGSNTGAATLSINGLTARPIVKWNGDGLVAGDLAAGAPAVVVASGAQFVLLNAQASFSDFARLSQGNTFTASQSINVSSAAIRTTEGAITSKLQSGAGTGGGLVGTESNHPFEIRTNNSTRATFAANGSDINLQATAVRANSSQICTANAVGCPAVSALSGSVSNGQVPQGAVTQHQAAMSIAATQLTGNMPDARIVQSNVTQHQAALAIAASQITSGTLPVVRGGTGATTSTGSGSVVLSASPTLSGTITGGTFSGTHSGNGTSLTSLNASNLASGTVPDARISSSSVTQHMDDGYARNITGKAGTTKNLVPVASCPPAPSGEDGRITFCY